jgi:hypothetical protein
MISLEHINLLEKKVSDAVHLIQILKEENKTLKRTIESSQTRMNELEELVTAFKHDQTAIETTVLNAIQKLDALEDEISDWETNNKNTPKQTVNAAGDSHSPQAKEQAVEQKSETVESIAFDTKPELQTEEKSVNASEDFELEQEEDTVITVDDLQTQNPNPAGLAEILDRPFPDQPTDTPEELHNNQAAEQADLLFFSQNLNDQHESLIISDREEPETEPVRLQLHGVQPLFQNKIYVQRQTEYRELDIF